MESTVCNDAAELLRSGLVRYASQLDCRLESSKGNKDGTDYFLHSVIGMREGGSWYCFSVVHVLADDSVGIWTRKMDEQIQSVLSAERTYRFDSNTFDAWLEGWFEEVVLEQLTRP